MPVCGSKFVSGSSRKATVAAGECTYSLDRPRSRGHMPSLVGDSGQVLGVQAGF